MRPGRSLSILLGLGLTLVLMLTALAYRPGLHGDFLFDDFANLPVLGASGPINNGPAFWRYITAGNADPTGRPLAMLSFLLDGRDWPTPAFPFKRTNLLLHLLNGLLLVQLLRQLGRELCGWRRMQNQDLRLDIAALLGGAFWVLHPLFVSTTLYVVQREAMLPALFSLAGLLLWLRGRRSFRDGEARRGLMLLALGLGGCTLLATLSKANGALLPALALSIEAVIPSGARRSQSYRRAMLLFAVLPATAIGGYLLFAGWQGIAHGISSIRPWTLGQRLLTEPRVLMDYLGLLWLPRPFTPGLFNDHIQPSISLWSPMTTVPALAAVTALIAGAILLRKRMPAVAAALLFYFVGQSMESSTIALELYFEHRNYLPALLMFWPLALWLCGVVQTTHASRPGGDDQQAPIRMPQGWPKAGLALVLLGGLAFMTHARAALWGDTKDQALMWARLNPDSPRAQAYAADVEIAEHRPDLAAMRLEPALMKMPDEVQLAFNLLTARCQMGHADPATIQATIYALKHTRDVGTLLAGWFEGAIGQSPHPACPEMDLDTVDRLLDAALANPTLLKIAGRRQDLYHLQGRIALMRGQPDSALREFDAALDQQVGAAIALRQAALLGASGYPRRALAHLDRYEAERDRESHPGMGMPVIHEWVLHRERYWDKELARLRNTLLADERTKDTPSA